MAPRHATRPHAIRRTALLGLCTVLWLGGPSARAVLPLRVPANGLLGPSASAVPAPSLTIQAREAEEQAGALYSAGRYGEALAAQQHAVQLHRRLVAEDPSQRPNLAASLHNLGVVLIRLGRKSEAIAPTQEALALYREVALARGGEASRSLERPLRNLVLLYFESNRFQDALPLANELVLLHRGLADAQPLAQAERMDVLNLRASLLVALNRPEDALADLEAAVALGRGLDRQAPQNPGVQYGLAGSLVNLSQVAELLGRYPDALPPAREAEALLRSVAGSQPRMMGDWAKALSRLGQAHARLGQPAQALPPLEESIALLRLLARGGPQETLTVDGGGFRDDLAHALETLAVVQQQLQRPREARLAAGEAMDLYRALAQGDPRYGEDVERTRSLLSSIPEASSHRR